MKLKLFVISRVPRFNIILFMCFFYSLLNLCYATCSEHILMKTNIQIICATEKPHCKRGHRSLPQKECNFLLKGGRSGNTILK